MAQDTPIPGLSELLVKLAFDKVARDKAADGAPGGAPAPAPGGAPPMDPSMMGGAPGGMPPGGAPPMDPSMMGGAMPGGMPGQPQQMPGQQPQAGGAPAAPQKMKVEDMIRAVDARLYNLQQQMTAMLNAQGVKFDPSVLVQPPGSFTQLPAEAAMPGGQADPTQGQGGGQQQSAISPIEPIQGAMPQPGGGGQKQGAVRMGQGYMPILDMPVTPASQAHALATLLGSRRDHASR